MRTTDFFSICTLALNESKSSILEAELFAFSHPGIMLGLGLSYAPFIMLMSVLSVPCFFRVF